MQFLPTAADLAGFEMPEGRDGASILPTLLGQSQPEKPYLAFTWRGTGVSTSLPESVTLVQNDNGLAEFRDADTGAFLGTPDASAPSGYALISGNWKIVVPHCHKNERPSEGDMIMVYDLSEVRGSCIWPSLVLFPARGVTPIAFWLCICFCSNQDPFETNNLNTSDTGKEQIRRLLGLAIDNNVTCTCFQC